MIKVKILYDSGEMFNQETIGVSVIDDKNICEVVKSIVPAIGLERMSNKNREALLKQLEIAFECALNDLLSRAENKND